MNHQLKVLMAGTMALGLWSIDAQAHPSGGVVGTGGTRSSGCVNGINVMYGTVGQTVVGTSMGANNTLCHGFWCFGGSRVVAVEDPPVHSDFPRELSFGEAIPNPSPGGVRFALALPKPARVALAIFDLAGREVSRSDRGEMVAGHHKLLWDGRNSAGQTAGSGVYFARLVVDGMAIGKRRLVLVR